MKFFDYLNTEMDARGFSKVYVEMPWLQLGWDIPLPDAADLDEEYSPEDTQLIITYTFPSQKTIYLGLQTPGRDEPWDHAISAALHALLMEKLHALDVEGLTIYPFFWIKPSPDHTSGASIPSSPRSR